MIGYPVVGYSLRCHVTELTNFEVPPRLCELLGSVSLFPIGTSRFLFFRPIFVFHFPKRFFETSAIALIDWGCDLNASAEKKKQTGSQPVVTGGAPLMNGNGRFAGVPFSKHLTFWTRPGPANGTVENDTVVSVSDFGPQKMRPDEIGAVDGIGRDVTKTWLPPLCRLTFFPS